MKGRLSLINGDKAYYTLGQISPEFKKVVVISTPLSEDKKTIKAENIGEYKILSDILLVDLTEIQKLKPLDYGNKLKVGSKVRYEQKNFEVAGIFKNSYAQLYIKSPILLQPFAIFNDISSALYSTLDDDQIIQNVNTNFRNGKYDADLLFRFIDSNNFKEKLYNVKSPPPFSSLQSIKLKKEVALNPSTFEGFVSDGAKLKLFYKKEGSTNIYVKDDDTNSSVNINVYPNIDSVTQYETYKNFELPFTIYASSDYNIPNKNFLTIKEGGEYDPIQKGLRPLNIGIPFDKSIASQYMNEIGNSFGYMKIRKTLSFFNYVLPKTILEMISDTSFTDLASMELDNFFDIYINQSNYGRPDFDISSTSQYLYLLKENSKIGEYTFSSKLHLKDKITKNRYDKLLSFGDIVFLRKKPFYVLKYFNKLNQTYCLLLNEEMKSKDVNTKTKFKKAFRIVEAETIYKNFKKDGISNFGLSSKFYSVKPNINSDLNQPKNNIITDLFLENKTEQLQKLKDFNPNLFNSFLLATKLVDKKLEKGEVKVNKKTLQKSPYIIISKNRKINNYLNISDYVDVGGDLTIKEGLFQSYLDGSIYENTPFSDKYNISDKVWKASCVAHFGTIYTNSYLNQFFDIKDVQDYITCMIFLDLIRIAFSGYEPTNVDFDVMIYNEEFGFNAFNFLFSKRDSKFGNASWRSSAFLLLDFGEGESMNKLIYNKIYNEGFFGVYQLAQNMFSIGAILQLAYVNKRYLLKRQKGENFNNLFSKFNLNINFKNLKSFMVEDRAIYLRLNYPSMDNLSNNTIFAPQSKLEFAENIVSSHNETLVLGLRKVDEVYGNFSAVNFTRLIDDLIEFCPDNFEYIINIVYDYTEMGIREYEKIETIEEKESIISQEYELLKDYKEKGYLLISNSEENQMLIDSHNDLVDEETGDVISIGIDKNETYIISDSDEQTERWRSYGFLDEKPNNIEESDLTTDIDNIFAETFEDEIDDIFADTF